MPTIAEYLKFANLQMAAEALFGYNAYKDGATLVPGAKPTENPLTVGVLITGNLHASKFTAIEATKFAAQWRVVADAPSGGAGVGTKSRRWRHGVSRATAINNIAWRMAA